MRSRVYPAFVAAAGAALLLVSLIATPVAGLSAGAAAAAQAEHDRIVAYWTPARMAAAMPRDMQLPGSPLIPAARGGIPGPPSGGGGGGGGGGDPTAVTGASWTHDGAVLNLTGKVYFVVYPWLYVCSGSAVNDASRPGYSLVLTAGHCAYDFKKGFVTNWLYVPDFDAAPVSGYPVPCSDTRYGCWTAAGLVVNSGFASQTSFTSTATRYDWAFAVVGPGGKTTTQLDALGSYPIQFGGVSAGNRLAAFGYPAASPYDGTDLTYCAGNIFSDSLNGNNTWGMKCNMTGGSSGGPWLAGLDETNGTGGTLSSLNSYGYRGGDSMYGPKFNSATQATYNAALTHTANYVTP
jgi:V8-like Glu-specific endopeptidase